MRAALFVNPRSGKGSPSVEELVAAARDAGARVHVLRKGESLGSLARRAATEVDVLGMAGGDGSLGVVAAEAIEHDLPFVCVPWGTRNHFATDAGLDTADPLAQVHALREGRERRIDVGRVGGRVFLNNVSLGIYARVVHRRERGRRQGESLARLRALLRSLPDHGRVERFVVDGLPVRASVLLVANNEYRLDLLALGERERLDEGVLSIYAARGLRRLEWTERQAEQVRIESRKRQLRAAVDGEPVLLRPPLDLRVDARALRLLVPAAE